MKNLKNWIINKLGGYTFDEYEEMKETMIQHYEGLKSEFICYKTNSPEIITLRAAKVVPEIDGDWEIFVRQEIVKSFADELLNSKLIEWDTDKYTKNVRGTIRIMKPLWEPIVCDM